MAGYLPYGYITTTNRGEQVITFMEIAFLGDGVELQPGLDTQSCQFLFELGATLCHIAVIVLLLKPKAYPISRPCSLEITLMEA